MFLLLFNRVPETRLEVPQTRVQDVRQNLHLEEPLNPQTNRHWVRSQRQALYRTTTEQVTCVKFLLHVHFGGLSTHLETTALPGIKFSYDGKYGDWEEWGQHEPDYAAT